MKKPLSPLICSYFASRNKGIQHWITNAVSYQQNIFDYLVYVGQKTVWGQTYAYDKIKNTKHYAQAVPIQSYETLHPYIEQMYCGIHLSGGLPNRREQHRIKASLFRLVRHRFTKITIWAPAIY